MEVQGAHRLQIPSCILCGANTVYNQAVNVSTDGTARDKDDFANFAYQWALMLEGHHNGKEVVFPGMPCHVLELSGWRACWERGT